jgi:hypothetical protein
VVADLKYQDSNGIRPVAEVDVEVWRETAGPTGGWSVAARLTTDRNGHVETELNFRESHPTYALRVLARNWAAEVESFLPQLPRSQDAGQTPHQVGDEPGETLDFSYTFTGGMANSLNVIETLRHGKAFVVDRRDPRESDPIRRVGVGFAGSPFTTFYNPVYDSIVLTEDHYLDDFTILHEYAHYVEEAISSFVWIPSSHSGCDYPQLQHAWMEGFADWFSLAVTTLKPVNPDWHSSTGTWNTLRSLPPANPSDALETPVCNPRYTPPSAASDPNDHKELYIAAALWDLTDGGLAEPCDQLSALDLEIIQIMDHELDIYGVGPTLAHFRDAAIARGMNASGLMVDIWGCLNLPWM